MKQAIAKLLLNDAIVVTGRIGETDRQKLRGQWEAAREKLDCAKLLLASDHFAEALHLGERAVTLGTAAAGALSLTGHDDGGDGDADDSAWAKTLRALGASGSELALVRAAIAVAREPLPLRNGDFAEPHVGRYENAVAAAEVLGKHLGKLILTSRQITFKRAQRLLAVAAAFAVIGTGLYFGLRDDPTITATASATFDENAYPAHHAADRDDKTEWLLPTRATGFIELRFTPRRIRNLRLINAHNPPFEDRATFEFQAEFYQGEKLLSAAKDKFPAFSSTPTPLVLPVDVRGVDRVRIAVINFHKSGGGLAEISWD